VLFRSQRRVEQVGRRMIQADRLAPLAVDARVQPVADLDSAAGKRADVTVGRAELLRVLDAELAARARQRAGVADLAAALGVERRAVEDDRAARAVGEPLDRRAVRVVTGRDRRVELEHVVAVELGGLLEGRRMAARRAESARLACALALRAHLALEARLVDRKAALA